MYITRKGQYALFFLIDLALHDGSTVTVKQVAKEDDLSEKYMDQVASKLRHAGIVRVIRGSKGGYYLPEETRRCTAKDVVGAIEGQRNAVDLDGYRESENNRTMNALVRDLGQEVDNAVDDVLERVTLAELVRQYHERETFSYII